MNRKPLIHLIIMTAIFLGAVGGYVWWRLSVEKASAEAAELEAQIERTMEETRQVGQVKGALALLAEDERAIQSYFVNTEDIVPFLESLESAGKGLGATVAVVSVADKPSGDGRIALSLRITGSFEAVMRTLGVIEYGPHDLRVSNLALDTDPAAAGSWTAAVTLSVGTRESPTP